ncbi:MAG: ferritin-like domain-containing protein [Acidimicrobiales bacterium]|nr:ferritin-like domain-containing protein [Acidimicrobiales bacterium]
MNPDLSRDELHRQLREIEAAQAALDRPFAGALRRALEARRAARPAAAGVDRRRFLVVGGGSVLAAAVLAACGGGNDGESTAPLLPQSGDTTTTTEAMGELEVGDGVLLRTAQSYELAAVDTYGTVLESGLVEDRDVRRTFELFLEQHGDHGDLFAQTLRDLGEPTVREANAFVMDQIVAPSLEAVEDQDGAIAFSHTLENIVAQTYQAFVEVLASTDNRQVIMSVGGVEARHTALIAGFMATEPPTPQVPAPFQPITDALGLRSYVA